MAGTLLMMMNEKEIPKRLLLTEVGNNRKLGRSKIRWIDVSEEPVT